MDPGLCCDPDIDTNCTVVPVCCMALLESNRHFYQLGMEKRNKEDMRLLHSTIFTVIGKQKRKIFVLYSSDYNIPGFFLFPGCVTALLALIILVTIVVCRLHVRRSSGLSLHLASGSNPSARPPLSLHDLDIYFSSLQHGVRRPNQGHQNGDRNIGITYNINNGVQFVTPPPPYR